MSNYNTLKTADTINAISIVDGAITTSKLNASVTTLIVSGSGPKVAAITYPGNDLAADPAGGQTITLTGTGFVSGCSVFVGTTQASVVTVVSATSVTFTAPALAAATYTLYLVNPDGGTATIVPGISYSGTPIWSTTAGTLGSVYEYSPISNATTATGDGSISYSVFSGTLPTGSSLNTSTGVITGTSPASAGATTYTFVIRATDAQLQDSDRSFSITVNIDPVTWTSPADNSTVTLNQNVASTTALSATSAAGKAITYTSTALPAGLSISGAAVTGTPTVLGTTATTFTATAATTGRTTTATINWTVSVAADTYFPYTTLLLSGAATTETFIADASTNNFAVTIAGDTKPNNFNPYTPGYYSNYFNGSGDYLSVASNAVFNFGTGDFTLEAWVYRTTAFTDTFIISSSSTGGMFFGFTGSNTIGYGRAGVAWDYQGASHDMSLNTWYHVALTRSGTSIRIFVNGVQVGVTQTSSQAYDLGVTTIGSQGGSYYWAGYISNARIVKGTAVYTGNFPVLTAPLTAITNTSLLTCQSNRFLDNSTNLFAITRAGSTSVQSFNPFVPNTAYATQGSTYFDGTTDYLITPSSSQFNLPGDFTIECWIHRTVNVDVIGLFGIGSTDPDSNVVRIVSGVLQFWLGGSNGGASGTGTKTGQINCSTVLLYNTWYHVALVRSGSAANNVKLYLNGVLDGQGTGTYQVPTNSFVIGKSYPGYAGEHFNGYISNVRVVKGVAVYTANFTPPVAPLSATQSETSLSTPPTVEYLVVAGGGGAGGSSGGGGGAGGYRTASGFAVAANTAITVTVGAGGSGGAANTKGSAGLNSVFSTITATGGGAGGTGYSGGDMIGGNGGSGGGGGYYGNGNFGSTAGGISSPVTSPVQGYAGGAGDPSLNIGGGGGGAGAVGSGGSGTTGAGGIGVQSSITGAATYYAGGGAGWSRNTASLGGLGGGGNESTAGTANTGGGGGANADYTLGGFAGGSGVVVIRYADTYVAATCTGSPEITIAGGYRIYKFVTSGTMYITFNTETKAAITGSATSLLTCQTNQPASNSMFLDSSTNAFPVTRAGNTSAGTFTPYGANWSNYFGMKTDYISIPATAPLTTFTGDFTFECWVNPTDTSISTNWGIWDSRQSGSTANAMIFTLQNLASPVTGQWRLGYYYGSGTQTYGTGIVLANQWTHVAFVRSGSTLTYYVNGVAGGTANVTGTQTGNSTSVVYIGSKDGSLGGYGTVGYISNFRIVNGTAVYTGNFAVPTAPLTAIAKTSLLTCQSNRSVDNSANAFVVTLGSATVSAQRFSPFSPQTQTAITHSGYFDGTGDYLTAPSNAAFGFGTGDFTIEAWIYRTDTGVQRGIVDSQAGAGSRILFYLTSNNLLNLFDGTSVWLNSAITVPANQWVHVAAVRISGTTKLYINGAQQASSSDVRNYGAAVTYIGRQYGTTTNDFMGYISNVRMVKGVGVYTGNFTVPTAPLTATQSSGTNIVAVTGSQTSLLTCQSPTFTDNSTNAFAITAFDGAKPRTLNPFGFTNASAAYSAATYGGSAYFDGNADYLTVPQNAAFGFGTGDFTVEGWYYLTAIVTDQALLMLGTGANGAGPIYCGWWLKYSSAGSLLFYRYDGTETTYSFSTTLVVNTWYHIACSRSGTSLRMFLNGTQIGATASSNLSFNNANSDPLQIGKCITGQGTFYYNGYVNNIRIVKGVAVYTANFTPPSAPLTAITNTSLLLNMTTSGIYDAASMSNLETVADAKLVATQTPYAGSYYSNYFDGTGDYLSVAANAALVFGTGDFTVELWFYIPGGITAPLAIIGNGTGGIDSAYWSLEGVAGGNIAFFGPNSATQYFATTTQPWTSGWAHIAVSRAGANTKLFLNGVQQGSTYTTNNSFVSGGNLYIGASSYTPGSRMMPAGYISNVRIVKGVAVYTGNFAVPTAPLTATQAGNGATISAITTGTSLLTCQSNRFVDNSANAFAITRSGNVAIQSFNPFQRNSAATLYFDGTGDYLVAPYNPAYNFGTGNFTIEFWVNTTSTAAYATALRLGNTWTTGSWSFYLNDVNGSGVPSWWSFTLNTTLSTSGVTINDGAWHHIALVRNSTTMTMYIDGTSRGTLAVSTSSVGDTTTQLWIARDASNVRELAGYINDLRITKGVARYTTTFTPPTTAFITK